jgi:hypothetical protein
MKLFRYSLLTCGCLIALAPLAWAGHPITAPPHAADLVHANAAPVIPAAFASSRYTSTSAKNPFQRVVRSTPPPASQWAQNWSLIGMYRHADQIRVSLINHQTGQYKHLSNHPSADSELRLVMARFNRDRTEASAEIAKGSDQQTIKYSAR